MNTSAAYSRELKNKYARIAYHYYSLGMTQQQIAERFSLSRQQVNRILRECVEKGIVRFSFDFQGEYLELESALENRYSLTAVRIASSAASDTVHDAIGLTAGGLLKSLVKSGDTIGLVPGRSIASMVYSMPEISKSGLLITQLIGSEALADTSAEIDSLIHRLAIKLSAATAPVYAPVIVSDRSVRDSIINEEYYKSSYKVMKSCNIAVVGIGNAKGHRTYLKEGVDYESSAVGEVCTHYFDAQGKPVDMPFSDRIIAIELQDFLAIPLRIGVAGGEDKLEAIKGALAGKYINALVTDYDTAKKLAAV